MARKYTIFKVLIQNLNKIDNSNRGFTLLELMIGLAILSVVIGLSLNAFNQASTDFNKDSKNIETNQNLSSVLQMIGNDIQQAGEQINEGSFPAIEFRVDSTSNADATTVAALNPRKASQIIIRKSVPLNVTATLNLCQQINANTATIPATLVVADSTLPPGNTCNFTAFAAAPVLPVSANSASIKNTLGRALLARQYRCQLDTPNPSYETTATNLCGTASLSGTEKLRAVIHDGNGHIRRFDYYDDNFYSLSAQYSISIGNNTGDAAKDIAAIYPVGSPIYLIEERVYALDANGNLTLSVNGEPPQILINKISQFNISAKLYNMNNTANTERQIEPNPSGTICPNPPATPSVTDPKYICQFNYNTLVTDPAMNWKSLAGVRVELQAMHDPSKDGAWSSLSNDQKKNVSEKLSARAEYFPRNVLSK